MVKLFLYSYTLMQYIKKYLFLKNGMSWLCVKRIYKRQITSLNTDFICRFLNL